MISTNIKNLSIYDAQGDNAQLYPTIVDTDNQQQESTQDDKSYVLTADRLEGWLAEIRNQPRWRQAADTEDDYYDGNQIDSETQEALSERGQQGIIDNQIGPVIRTVLGMQAKSRMDTLVKPESGETNSDVAEALSCKMKQYASQCRSDRAKSDAYAEMIKTGFSTLHVGQNDDPFGAPFIYEHINRREAWYDWRAKPDWSDARYFIRRKWIDQDQLIGLLPDKKDFILSSLAGRANWDMELMTNQYTSRGYQHDVNNGFNVSVEQYEWMNVARRRLLTYEIWYRVKTEGLVYKDQSGKVVEFDQSDPVQMLKQQHGMIKPYKASYDKIRVGFWIGPQRVGDWESPYKHRHIPYIPMFCFRENRTGIPYGLIRTMMSPQDEINARKTKMMWLLNAKWVEATKGSVDDHAVAANEVARPDGYIIVNNKAGEKFEVHENQPMAAQQFQVMQEAKETLQTVAGVHNATLGRDSGATSGLAINSLVEQDSITLAEPNDNFNMACRQADELFLYLIRDEISESKDHSVTVDGEMGEEKIIVLNQTAIDPQTGLQTIVNDITKVNIAVVLGEIPQTPTFRNQQLVQLTEIIKGLPPQAQMQFTPDIILATDLPNRKQMAQKLMKSLGQTGGDDPEKAAMQQEIESLKQQLAMKNPPEIVAATVAKLQAETRNADALASTNNVKALYESLQAAGIVVTNPNTVPVADSIAKSAGVKDMDGGSLVGDAQGIAAQPDQIPQPVSNNPSMPAQPSQGLPEEMKQPGIRLSPSPATGEASGIEGGKIQAGT